MEIPYEIYDIMTASFLNASTQQMSRVMTRTYAVLEAHPPHHPRRRVLPPCTRRRYQDAGMEADEENEDAREGDAPGHAGFRARLPTPMDQFNTPPQTRSQRVIHDPRYR
jgi:hypothetical protein